MLMTEALSLAINIIDRGVRSRTDLVSSNSLNHETSFFFCRDTLSLARNVKCRDPLFV
jgi:hypothetical protein